jgi:hypothetical protein
MENDIYILLEKFNKDDVNLFRSNYLKNFSSLKDYFEYPSWYEDGSEPEFATENIDEMIDFMMKGNKGYFRFYFDSPTSPSQKEIYMGMIFFNEDDTLVLGVKIHSSSNEYYMAKLSKDFNSNLIMICEEDTPPSTKKEFMEILG